MITFLRRQLQGSAYKGVLWFLVAILGFGSFPALLRKSTTGGPWAVRVNEQEISGKEYGIEVSRQQEYISSLRSQYGQYAEMFLQSMGASANPKMLAFDYLIKEELINQVADRLSFNLDDDYIAHKLVEPSFFYRELAGYAPVHALDKTGINLSVLRAHLKRQGMSMPDFERKIERILMRNIVMDIVSVAGYTPDFAVRQHYIAQKSDKKLSLLVFDSDEYLKKVQKEPLTDEEIKTFFDEQNARSKRYVIPEKRSGNIWLINANSYGVKISDEKIKSYYEKNKTSKFVDSQAEIQVRRIVFSGENLQDGAAVLQEAQKVRADLILNPDKFAQIAKEISSDTETKSKGGLLPFFSKGSKERSFEQAAFLLKSPGDISEVLETKSGLELIQLVEKKAKTFKPLNDVRNDIKQKLLGEIFKEKFAHDAQDLLLKVTDNPEVLSKFVDQKNATKRTVSSVQRGESPSTQALFKLQNIGAVGYYFEKDLGAIVQLTEVAKSYMPTVEEVKDVVVQDLYAKKAHSALQLDVKLAREKAKLLSFEQLRDEFNISLERTGWVHSDSGKLPEKLISKEVTPEVLTQLDTEGLVITHRAGKNGILIRLDEIKPFDQDRYDQIHDELRKEVASSRMQVLTDGFVASLYRNATIDTNESLFATQE